MAQDDFTIATFIPFLENKSRAMTAEVPVAMAKGAHLVVEEAKRALGTYDYGWPKLAEATIDSKGADTPGVDTGEMRDSIEYTVEHDGAYVGSNLDRALFFEMGTASQPPRPFLSEAAARVGEEVANEIVGHLFESTFGRR
jgi:HK97 gp10 family phage protein